MALFRPIGVRFPVSAAFALFAALTGVRAQTPPAAPLSQKAELLAGQQRVEGDLWIADGNVEIRYRNLILRADHVQYNEMSNVATARGHVQLDVDVQHLEADSATLNLASGKGSFTKVRGELRLVREPNSNVLVTPNPLTFEASEVRRLNDKTYAIDHVWLTVCRPDRPVWKFHAAHATLHVDRSMALVHANFRLFRIPLIYLPFASVPAGKRMRQSGFLIPAIGNSTVNGFVFGDAYYWAPRNWMDLNTGLDYLSRRGWQQDINFRATPSDNITMSARYFGVVDRGLPQASGPPLKQGGHSMQFEFSGFLKNGWHAAADLNQLTSLTFQLAFAPTFSQAVNSEVRSSAFLTNNFRGFSVNLAMQAYRDYLNAQPVESVSLRSAPEARFSSVDQAPWRRWPVYFGFDSLASAIHRDDPQINTPSYVTRYEIAPRVVVPLHWGPWLSVTSSYTLRSMRYGARIFADTVIGTPIVVNTGELSVDLRPPAFERVWNRNGSKWKHTIEPDIVYDYVRGVNQFDRFIRVDEDDTLTDTNEFEYSVTQRLFHRRGDAQADELVSWKIAQKYYFDPTFGGALVPGTRNVFQALDSLTPFAFADEPRRFSPIVSELTLSPGGKYDAEIITDYDTVRRRFTTNGTLVKLHPAGNFTFSLAHFLIDNESVLQPVSNQIRTQAEYGDLNRRGWNASAGFSYDINQAALQNQFVELSYNGGCCGIGIEYLRLSLGPVRTENQFRVALIIANIGNLGNLRRQAKIF